jgi:hypothetical protein
MANSDRFSQSGLVNSRLVHGECFRKRLGERSLNLNVCRVCTLTPRFKEPLGTPGKKVP